MALIVKNFVSFSALAISEEFCFRQSAGVEEAEDIFGTWEEMKSETSLLKATPNLQNEIPTTPHHHA